jgi:putative PIN family toxin of toxin-antitoxin system
MSAFRAVLDTNILVSALLSPAGNPAKIYRMFLAGILDLVVSADILAEYEDVLHRPRLSIPAADAGTVLFVVRRYGEKVQPVPSKAPLPDEDDRAFYDAAKYGNAYLVTGNTKHYPQESFILTPAAFLALE